MNSMLLASTDFESMSREDLINFAIDVLKNDDDIFVACVDELDSWDGYADGFRAWDMSELDEFYCNVKATKPIEDLTKDFNINDDYFYFSIYGLESTNSKVDLYRDNVWESELLDGLIDNYSNLDLRYIDEDFDKLLKEITTKEEGEG